MQLSRKEGLVFDKVRSDMLSKNQSRIGSQDNQIYIGEYKSNTFSGSLVHSMLNFAKRLPFENGIIYNRGTLMTIRGNEESIGLDNVPEDFLKNAIVLHSHTTKNTSISGTDVRQHLDSQMKMSIVVDKNGNKYFLSTNGILTPMETSLIMDESRLYAAKIQMKNTCNLNHQIMLHLAEQNKKIKYLTMLMSRDHQ